MEQSDTHPLNELSFFLCSAHPAEDLPECSGEAGRAAGPQQPQRSHGRQQPDETAAAGEREAEAEATGAASAETTGQESHVHSETFWKYRELPV